MGTIPYKAAVCLFLMTTEVNEHGCECVWSRNLITSINSASIVHEAFKGLSKIACLFDGAENILSLGQSFKKFPAVAAAAPPMHTASSSIDFTCFNGLQWLASAWMLFGFLLCMDASVVIWSVRPAGQECSVLFNTWEVNLPCASNGGVLTECSENEWAECYRLWGVECRAQSWPPCFSCSDCSQGRHRAIESAVLLFVVASLDLWPQEVNVSRSQRHVR